MGKKRKHRRQTHGSAWLWRQTNGWYCTLPGTRKCVALFDEEGHRIRGKENKKVAELALARKKLSWETLIELYHERWEEEFAIDELKTHQRERPVLRSQTPAGVLQEIYGLLIATISFAF